jgi:hypothetical protein
MNILLLPSAMLPRPGGGLLPLSLALHSPVIVEICTFWSYQRRFSKFDRRFVGAGGPVGFGNRLFALTIAYRPIPIICGAELVAPKPPLAAPADELLDALFKPKQSSAHRSNSGSSAVRPGFCVV